MDFFFSAIGSDQNTAGEGCPRGKGDIGIFKPGQVHLDKGYFHQNEIGCLQNIFFVFGIFKPARVHLDKGYFYQNIIFVFGKGHIVPS